VTKPSPLECFVCFRQVCGGRPVEAQATLVFVTWWDFWSPEDIKRKQKNSAASLHWCISTLHPTPRPTLPSPLWAPYTFGAGPILVMPFWDGYLALIFRALSRIF